MARCLSVDTETQERLKMIEQKLGKEDRETFEAVKEQIAMMFNKEDPSSTEEKEGYEKMSKEQIFMMMKPKLALMPDLPKLRPLRKLVKDYERMKNALKRGGGLNAMLDEEPVQYSEAAVKESLEEFQLQLQRMEDASDIKFDCEEVESLQKQASQEAESGDYQSALGTLDLMLNILEQKHGPHHPSLCLVLSARLRTRAMGRCDTERNYADAIRCVAVAEKHFGHHHVFVGEKMLELASVEPNVDKSIETAQEGLEILRQILGPVQTFGEALASVAPVFVIAERPSEALELLKEAHSLLKTSRPELVPHLHRVAATARKQLGDTQGALRSLDRALKLAKGREDYEEVVFSLFEKARALVDANRMEEAAEAVKEADALPDVIAKLKLESEFTELRISTLGKLAGVTEVLEEAKKDVNRLEAEGASPPLVYSLERLASIQAEVGEIQDAYETFGKAVDLCDELKIDHDATMMRSNQAHIGVHLQKPEAPKISEECVAKFRTLGEEGVVFLARALINHGNVLMGCAKDKEAVVLFKEVMELKDKIPNPAFVQRCHFQALNGLAHALYSVGAVDEALGCFNEKISLCKKLGVNFDDVWLPMGDMYVMKGDLQRGETALDRAERALANNPMYLGRVHYLLARIYFLQGHVDHCVKKMKEMKEAFVGMFGTEHEEVFRLQEDIDRVENGEGATVFHLNTVKEEKGEEHPQ